MRNKSLIVESAIATILTLIVALLLFAMPLNFKIFDPLKKAFKKIDLLDVYYSEIRAGKSGFSAQDKIVLLNIAKLNRAEIGNVLEKLNEYDPAVIGLDLNFLHRTSDSVDAPLREKLNAMKAKLVLATLKTGRENRGADPYFGKFTEGYSNLISEGDPAYSPVRKVQFKDGDYLSFTYRILEKYDQEKLKNIGENFDLEYPQLINYYGSYNRFLHFEHDEIISGNKHLNILKDKIVLVGDFGKTFDDHLDVEDRFHTPLNPFGAGVGFPDMKGALIHANILQMLIDESLIVRIPEYLNWIISLTVTFFLVILFGFYFVRRHLWFHIVAKGVQIILAMLLLLFSIYLYAYFQIKYDPKYLLLLVILSVDVLYLYEAIVSVLHKKYHTKSYFIHDEH